MSVVSNSLNDVASIALNSNVNNSRICSMVHVYKCTSDKRTLTGTPALDPRSSRSASCYPCSFTLAARILRKLATHRIKDNLPFAFLVSCVVSNILRKPATKFPTTTHLLCPLTRRFCSLNY